MGARQRGSEWAEGTAAQGWGVSLSYGWGGELWSWQKHHGWFDLLSSPLKLSPYQHKAVLRPYHSCVHWSSTYNFLQEFFLCIHNLVTCLVQVLGFHFKMIPVISLIMICLHSYWLCSIHCTFHTNDSFILQLEVCTYLSLSHISFHFSILSCCIFFC